MIAIKNMQMPQDCYNCPMCHIAAWDFPVRYACNVMNRWIDVQVQGEKEKPEWCPLIEINVKQEDEK